MVTIKPQVDSKAGLLRIEIPMGHKDQSDITVETPLDPTPEQLATYELIDGIEIWGVKVRKPCLKQHQTNRLDDLL